MANTRRFANESRRRASGDRWRTLRQNLTAGGWSAYLLAGLLVPFTLGISFLIWRRWLYTACPYAGFIDEACRIPGCLIHPSRRENPADECVDIDRRRTNPWWLIPWLRCDPGFQCATYSVSHCADADRRDWYEATVERDIANRLVRRARRVGSSIGPEPC